MNRIKIEDNSDESFEEILQNTESEGDQEIGRTLSALSRPDTPISAYRRGFVEDLEAHLDELEAKDREEEEVLDSILDSIDFSEEVPYE